MGVTNFELMHFFIRVYITKVEAFSTMTTHFNIEKAKVDQ
jgi:hypothetical protein